VVQVQVQLLEQLVVLVVLVVVVLVLLVLREQELRHLYKVLTVGLQRLPVKAQEVVVQVVLGQTPTLVVLLLTVVQV
jgi:hypothetical protein